MPSHVETYHDYRIAIYSPAGHFAVISPPGRNAVLGLGARQPRSTVVEGVDVCLDRAKALVDGLSESDGHPSGPHVLPLSNS
ncbi:hypothetical protein D3C73_918920 [compost metagenome]